MKVWHRKKINTATDVAGLDIPVRILARVVGMNSATTNVEKQTLYGFTGRKERYDMSEIKYGAFFSSLGEPTRAERRLTNVLRGYRYSTKIDEAFMLRFVEGSCWDSWVLLYEGECVFNVQESSDGYIINMTNKGITDEVVDNLEKGLSQACFKRCEDCGWEGYINEGTCPNCGLELSDDSDD